MRRVEDRIGSRAGRAEPGEDTVEVEEEVVVGGGACVLSSSFFNVLMLCSCEESAKDTGYNITIIFYF